MTKERIEELRALAAAATEGPWHASDQYGELLFVLANDGGYLMSGRSEKGHKYADFQFAAAARTAIPALCARVEELEARNPMVDGVDALALGRGQHHETMTYLKYARDALDAAEARVARLEEAMREAYENCEQCRMFHGRFRCARCQTFAALLEKSE